MKILDIGGARFLAFSKFQFLNIICAQVYGQFSVETLLGRLLYLSAKNENLQITPEHIVVNVTLLVQVVHAVKGARSVGSNWDEAH